MNIKTSYFSIPESIFSREDLSLLESCLYGLILSIEQSGSSEVWASNQYFATKLKTSVRSVIRALNKLESVGLITKEINQQGKMKQRTIKTRSSCLVLDNKQGDKLSQPHDTESLPPCQNVTPPVTKCHTPRDKMSHQYKYNINNKIRESKNTQPPASLSPKDDKVNVRLDVEDETMRAEIVRMTPDQITKLYDKIIDTEVYCPTPPKEALFNLFVAMEDYFSDKPKRAKTANFYLTAVNWINREVQRHNKKNKERMHERIQSRLNA